MSEETNILLHRTNSAKPLRDASAGKAHARLSPALQNIAQALAKKPFVPHPLFANGHAQTIAAHVWRRRFDAEELHNGVERFFDVAPGVLLLARCHWLAQPYNAHPTILLAHGLEGSSESHYMLGTALKAYRAGFNVVRLNLRNCGNTEHLTPTLYNSGLSEDAAAVARELIEHDELQNIFLVGFSLSGNIMLKLAGEQSAQLPREISGVCAVSPSLDLHACATAIEQRRNRLYQHRFMKSLRRRLRHKQQLYPHLYDASDVRHLRTIRDFDEKYTARDGGYKNADDYYTRASALRLVRHIERPTLILHAQDDPFIPFASFRDSSIAENPNVLLLAPSRGGHVGFLASNANGEDRFWAENRIVDFCQLVLENFKQDD